MRAADYAALAAQLDNVLHHGVDAGMQLIPSEVKPATVATRLADIWWGTPAPLPPLVGKSKAAKAAEPGQSPYKSCRCEFVLMGPVVPAARPRVFRGGGIGIPLPYVLFKRAIQRAALRAGAKQIESDGWKVALEISMWQPNPLAKPDLDNAEKGVMDALTALGLFRDERVTHKVSTKVTGPHGLSVRVLW